MWHVYCHPGTQKRNNKLSNWSGDGPYLTHCLVHHYTGDREYGASLGFKESGGLCSDEFISHGVQLVCNSSGKYEEKLTKCRLG
jgi:hypothetical protein